MVYEDRVTWSYCAIVRFGIGLNRVVVMGECPFRDRVAYSRAIENKGDVVSGGSFPTDKTMGNNIAVRVCLNLYHLRLCT